MKSIGVFSEQEVTQLIQKIEPTIRYSLSQTKPEYRDELKQHLYLLSLTTMQNVNFKEPESLFLHSI